MCLHDPRSILILSHPETDSICLAREGFLIQSGILEIKIINKGVSVMKCEHLQACPFYNDKMDIESGIGKMYKKRYCLGNKEECARYIVNKELGAEFVLVNLYPNMHGKADEIIAQSK